MKIILTARTFVPPFTGGVDVYAGRLARALRRMGHETVFVAFDSAAPGPGIRAEPDEHDGQRVWRLRFNLEQRPKIVLDSGYDQEMGAAFHEVLRRETPDLVLVLNFYLLSLAAVEAAKALGLPVAHIATDFVPICRRATLIRWNGEACRDGENLKNCTDCFLSHSIPGRAAAGFLNRVLDDEALVRTAARAPDLPAWHPIRLADPYWRQARIASARLQALTPLRQMVDLVVAPTRFTTEQFRRGGFAPERVVHLPFGVEPEGPLAALEKTPSDAVRFLFIGRLQPYKGAHVLLEAFNRLDSPRGAQLMLYGTDDGYPRYFRGLMEMVRGNDGVQFGGSLPPARLHEAFQGADYFVLPSVWHENTPLILLDALQSGTPVIASDIGGVRDSVQEGTNGFLFPMGDAAALQAVLQRCIDRPELLHELRPRADLPEIDEYARRLLALLEERLAAPSF